MQQHRWGIGEQSVNLELQIIGMPGDLQGLAMVQHPMVELAEPVADAILAVGTVNRLGSNRLGWWAIHCR